MHFMMLSINGGAPELVAQTADGARHRVESLYRRAADSAVTPRVGRPTLDDLLEANDPFAAARWLENRLDETPSLNGDEEIRWDVPLERGDLICVGRNYAAHARELGNEPPGEPVLFMKPRAALTPHEGEIVLPQDSERVDFEGELGLIIGRPLAGDISEKQAREALFGLTLFNDVTDRAGQSALKKAGKPWFIAKGRATFAPCGPTVLTLDRGDSLDDFAIETRVNGDIRQQGNPTQWIFPAATLIAYLAKHIGLRPGDIIATGTPEGVGPLNEGDVVEISSPRIGTLRNRVVSEAAAK